VGEPIKDFLKDVKDSTLKVIMAELDKTEIVKPEEVQQKRVLRDEDEEEKVPAGGIELPRQDVSKEMSNSKLIAKLTDKNWKNKKEGLDKVGAILDGANNRIEPKGLKDLFGALKLGIGDKNKNVLKMVL
jgi:cytoskeleton-associated protein 5